MDKFKNKYRIASARAQWWNYGWDAAYFLTINTKNRQQYFGQIIDDEMILSHAGKIADLCWREIPDHAENIELGVYVIMPNHVHGILILDGNVDGCCGRHCPNPSVNPDSKTLEKIPYRQLWADTNLPFPDPSGCRDLISNGNRVFTIT